MTLCRDTQRKGSRSPADFLQAFAPLPGCEAGAPAGPRRSRRRRQGTPGRPVAGALRPGADNLDKRALTEAAGPILLTLLPEPFGSTWSPTERGWTAGRALWRRRLLSPRRRGRPHAARR